MGPRCYNKEPKLWCRLACIRTASRRRARTRRFGEDFKTADIEAGQRASSLLGSGASIDGYERSKNQLVLHAFKRAKKNTEQTLAKGCKIHSLYTTPVDAKVASVDAIVAPVDAKVAPVDAIVAS
eukprot:3400008-Pleurochrysis_carterae.AAC.1